MCREGSHISADSQESVGTGHCFKGIVCDGDARGNVSALTQREDRREKMHNLALLRFNLQLAKK